MKFSKSVAEGFDVLDEQVDRFGGPVADPPGAGVPSWLKSECTVGADLDSARRRSSGGPNTPGRCR